MLPAKLIEIHCSEQDRYDDKPLYEAIVERCRGLKIAGATVLRGVEGYGKQRKA
jgi:PII-like signaling protein